MKRDKKGIWTYGTILCPIELNKPVLYYNNGILKRTLNVERIIEATDDHIIFDTSEFSYCIAYNIAEEEVRIVAA